jgi:MFS family permease
MVEGAGYLVLVIAIPAIASAVAPPSWRAPVLAAWGGFVPVGFAAADFLAGWVLPAAGPEVYLLAATAVFALLAVLAAALLGRVTDWPKEKDRSPVKAARGLFAATLNGPVILVALAFGIYVVLSVGFFTFMPAFVASGSSAILLSAGMVALLVPLGNLATSVLVRGSNGRFAAMLAAGGFAVTAAAAVPAFAADAALLATAAAVLLAVSGGVTASALFASVPFIVPRTGSASVAIGLIAQTGGFATVFGPPLAGHVIDNYAWIGFGWFIAAWAVIGVASLTPLLVGRREGDLAF